MRQFDPWPVFFKREWNHNWPFLVGFTVTGFIVTKFSLGLIEEDTKNSPFVQRHNRKGKKYFFSNVFRVGFKKSIYCGKWGYAIVTTSIFLHIILLMQLLTGIGD